ncbi:NADPH-dependent glutamate synthase beta chain [Desulfatibacillum alkenivorans DSM 16219]|uniref:NADPH-dependent glutamate synthase beta chain n=1 Tax=Desulfatibacillum alkenivorans DSM 16219 TaxID=1121393 RepID=A0A1M6IYE7_9BACT|nr:FAD-dependent oxidoreductase [Desulfatibacillum alkenivorans]SHJ39459.1 NADPH-dependent glutamate synthase beta chain [Desulfatibacillum alkenivorans DSM 16219]
MKRAKDRLHRVVVLGATPSGIAAANKLGELGVPVTLVDSEPDLHEKLSQDKWRLDSGMAFSYAHRSGLMRIMRNQSIKCILPGEVTGIKHTAQGFAVKVNTLPQYVDPERCTLCGNCVEACPVTSADGCRPIVFSGNRNLPGRPVIDKRQRPLCQDSCPLGVNAQGYVALAGAGRFSKALDLIRRDNVLPGICGRVCTHPCEDACRRGDVDGAVAIRDIKRFVADKGGGAAPQAAEKKGKKIAVIGSGPAGIAAAADFARQGVAVTVFEKEKEVGGLLRYGIGPHRLPRSILDQDLEYVKALGVEFITGKEIDFSKDLEDLTHQYDAVLITTGSWKDRKLGAKGEDCQGVTGCLDFLNDLYRNDAPAIKKGEKLAVIGDGNSAFDAARAARRLGADVTIVSWFAKGAIPADAEEVHGALAEDIDIVDEVRVVEFVQDKGKIKSLLCKPTEPGPADANGICWPVLKKDGDARELAFDKVIVAIGQVGPFLEGAKPALETTDYGFIKIYEAGQTSMPGVYAAGDAVNGPTTVVRSMASGRATADAICENLLGYSFIAKSGRPVDKDFCDIPANMAHVKRCVMPEADAKGRIGSFAEVAQGLTETQVLNEAGRCLQCGVCSECLECMDACGPVIHAIRHDAVAKEDAEHAGVLIIADPDMAPGVRGEDVIRAYGPPSAKTNVYNMITRGFAAAGKAMAFLARTSQRPKGYGVPFAAPDPGLSPSVRTGVFVCRCNGSMGWDDQMDAYVESLTQRPDVAYAEILESACIPEGSEHIVRTVREKGISRVVLASCVCCPLDFVCTACTDQRSRLKDALFKGTGISRSMVETCNLRGEVLPLLARGGDVAVGAFKGLLERSLKRAAKLKPLPTPLRNYNFTTAVVGQSESAINSALTLAEAGLEVLLMGGPSKPLEKIQDHPNIHSFAGSSVKAISGNLGNFRVLVQTGDGGTQALNVGSVILGQQALRQTPYLAQEGMQGRPAIATMQKKGEPGVPFLFPGATSIAGLFTSSPPGIHVSDRKKGAATAVLAASVMPRGPRQNKGYTSCVDADRCRGCGSCVAVCPYQAIGLKQNTVGGWYAFVDEALCKGCGNCISVCPNNAADSPYRNQKYLEQMLEEVL